VSALALGGLPPKTLRRTPQRSPPLQRTQGWGTLSCDGNDKKQVPPLRSLSLCFGRDDSQGEGQGKINFTSKVKGVGQECPTHTSKSKVKGGGRGRPPPYTTFEGGI
jgi:hypothetical protein